MGKCPSAFRMLFFDSFCKCLSPCVVFVLCLYSCCKFVCWFNKRLVCLLCSLLSQLVEIFTVVLGLELDKRKALTCSDWEAPRLTNEQVSTRIVVSHNCSAWISVYLIWTRNTHVSLTSWKPISCSITCLFQCCFIWLSAEVVTVRALLPEWCFDCASTITCSLSVLFRLLPAEVCVRQSTLRNGVCRRRLFWIIPFPVVVARLAMPVRNVVSFCCSNFFFSISCPHSALFRLRCLLKCDLS